jgi:hypothetical protein
MPQMAEGTTQESRVQDTVGLELRWFENMAIEISSTEKDACLANMQTNDCVVAWSSW